MAYLKNAPKNTSKKHINIELLTVLIPMITAAIAVLSIALTLSAKSVIESEAKDLLYQESRANASDISGLIEGILNYYDGLADIIQKSKYTDDEHVLNTLMSGMHQYPDVVIDCYIGYSDKGFLDGGGWIPGSDYDPTTRSWYKDAIGSEEMWIGAPSLDLTTGKMVVCASRKVTIGSRVGVLSIDIVLSGISDTVSAYTPSKTGKSSMLSKDMIIASPESNYVGTKISEHSEDKFLNALGNIASTNTSEIHSVKGNDNNDYLVSFVQVDNTDWILISYVKEKDVLAPLTKFIYISVGLAIIVIIITALILTQVISLKITKPVGLLTSNITRIAEGDFTVTIPSGGENEIGVMNNNMHDYVSQMHDTLIELKDVTEKLTKEAANSKNVSGELNVQADEQSRSMQQIQKIMNDMSYAVTDLAEQATVLAQEVGNLTQQSEVTKTTVDGLVTKARNGQRDMNVVQSGMNAIATSMQDMSKVVDIVDESAQKINSIIDMINSISSQTNLLSLNASIEAARAGEAGRGFAVVANEIGQLAQNSATSTAQISAIINDITAQIADLSSKSVQNMTEINTNLDAVTTAGNTFEEIFKSLDETTNIVKDMIGKVGKLNEVATSMAAISEEQSASTEEVSATATHLAESAQRVAESSRGVEQSASAVSDASARIEKLTDTFIV